MARVYTIISEWIAPLRGRLMVAFVLIVGMYFVLSFGEQAWRARELERDVAQRQQEIAELRELRDELHTEIEHYESEQYSTYVEQAARRDLNLAYPGETVLLVRWSSAPEPTPEEPSDTEPSPLSPNWRKWIEFLRS